VTGTAGADRPSEGWSRAADLAWELVKRIHLGTRKPANWVQLFKFGVVGVSGYAINLLVFWALAHPLEFHHLTAAVGAFCVAVTNNWIWNRHWTFRASDQHAGHQGARFLAVSLIGLAVNLGVLELLVGAGLPELGAQALAVAVAMPVNFVANKLWTFDSATAAR
jgi:dolichol-phosphate mannosyltransferase